MPKGSAFGYKLNYKFDSPDYRDFKFVHELLTLPTLVDMRNIDSAIRDQGQEGSCTAFTGEGSYHFVNNKQGLVDYLGSPQFLYYNERVDMGTVSQDSGASIREIFSALSKSGICKENTWPYSQPFTMRPNTNAYAEGIQHVASQYLSVSQQLDQIRGAIASGFPVAFGFNVYQNFESAAVASTGVVPMPAGMLLGGHANMLLGYDDSRQVFISRNSWGTSFGDKGYLYFPYSFILNSGISSDFWTLKSVSGGQPPVPPTPTPTPTPVVTETLVRIDGVNTYKQSTGVTRTQTWSVNF